MRLKAAAITVCAGAACLALTRVLWPFSPGMAVPPTSLLPLFIALNVISCLLFGAGVAFASFGYPMLRRARQKRGLTLGAYLSIAFLLLNWWPHSNLHAVVGMDFSKVVLIDYGFHVPLMAAGVVTALFFMRALAADGELTVAAPVGPIVRSDTPDDESQAPRPRIKPFIELKRGRIRPVLRSRDGVADGSRTRDLRLHRPALYR